MSTRSSLLLGPATNINYDLTVASRMRPAAAAAAALATNPVLFNFFVRQDILSWTPCLTLSSTGLGWAGLGLPLGCHFPGILIPQRPAPFLCFFAKLSGVNALHVNPQGCHLLGLLLQRSFAKKSLISRYLLQANAAPLGPLMKCLAAAGIKGNYEYAYIRAHIIQYLHLKGSPCAMGTE